MLINTPTFAIAQIGESHLDQILNVYRQCEDFLSLGPVHHASHQMVLDDLALSKSYGGIFCGIFISDQLVGIIDFVPSNHEGVANHAFLSLLMIAQPHRSKGLGKSVVAAVEAYILNDPLITAILSGVQTNNNSAILFWTSLGYNIVGGPELMPDTTVVYHLRKAVR